MPKNTDKYEMIDISELHPYENNARTHSESQLEAICNSIKEFGFINPVIIDENNMILVGHGRIEASKRLGMTQAPFRRVTNLTDDQKKAYILADNKLSDLGGWDEEMLAQELESISLDMSAFGFDDFNIDIDEPELDGFYGDARLQTDKKYNLDLMSSVELTKDFWQMPIIKNQNFIPNDIVGFNYAMTNESKDCGIHCFVDDYQFERLWNCPDKYFEILSQYQCFFSPDFSLYMDMPMSMKIWNIYRSRMIGAYYQSKGIKVIPTISWAEKETFEFCFLGIESKSVVAVSTIGVKTNDYSLKIWKDGMDEMIKRIKPSAIIVYGGKLEYDYNNIKVYYFENKVTENWKKGE